MDRIEALAILKLDETANVQDIAEAYQYNKSSIEDQLSAAVTQKLKLWCLEELKSIESAYQILAASLDQNDQAALEKAKLNDLIEKAPINNKNETGKEDSVAGIPDIKTGDILLDRYEIRSCLGSGSTGTVYSAFDRMIDDGIAIKIFFLELTDNQMVLKMLTEGVRLSQKLSHPNIVNVFDIHKEKNYYFITIELLEGQTLRHSMNNLKSEQKKLHPEEVLSITKPLCEALSYMHNFTFHGNIKPENVFLTENGIIKIMDFGLAGLHQASRLAGNEQGKGTAPYIAPEQLNETDRIDHRADQYAVGAMMYEMLTGSLPKEIAPPVYDLRKDISESLSDAVRRALNPKPEKRHKDMPEFLAAAAPKRLTFSSIVKNMRGIVKNMCADMSIIKNICADMFGKTYTNILKIPFVADNKALSITGIVLGLLGVIVFISYCGYLFVGTPKDTFSERESVLILDRFKKDTQQKQQEWLAFNSSLDIFSPESVEKAKTQMQKGKQAIEANEFGAAVTAYADAAELYDNAIKSLRDELFTVILKKDIRVNVLLDRLEADKSKLMERVKETRQAAEKYEQEDDKENLAKTTEELTLLDELSNLSKSNIFEGGKILEIKTNVDMVDGLIKKEKYSEALAFLEEAENDLNSPSMKVVEVEAAIRAKAATTSTFQTWKSLAVEGGTETETVQEAFHAYDKANQQLRQNEWQASKETYIEAMRLFESAIVDEKNKPAGIKEADGIATEQIIKSDIIESMLKGFQFVRIKPGRFLMGSPSKESGRDKDERQHRVRLTKEFYMQTTEVTQGLWQAVMGSNPSRFKDCGADCPVENISWYEIQQFIEKMNKIDSRRKYRLPTEAEWEYACRAATKTPFSFGKCLSTNQANYNGNHPYKGCSKGKDRKGPVAVAGFTPNAWGLYDMHGNVNEWCQDKYEAYSSKSVNNPTGPSSGSYRVLRGGSWNYHANYCRSAFRSNGKPDAHYEYLGFRLVFTPVVMKK